jgi:predicted acetyltransferase
VITHPIPSMHQDIRALWKQAFGDNDAFLDHYFQTMYSDETMLVCVEDDEEIVAMLTMFPIDLLSGGKRICARYVYAVATDEQWRGLGISTSLMEDAVEQMRAGGTQAAILVPAHFSLFDFYERQEFQTVFYASEDSIKADALPPPSGKAMPLSASDLYTLRARLHSHSRLFAQWDEKTLSYIIESVSKFGGFALRFVSDRGEGYAIASKDHGVCFVKELGLFGMDKLQGLSLLHQQAGANVYVVHNPSDGDPDPMPFGMIRWLDEEAEKQVQRNGDEPYFALVMD